MSNQRQIEDPAKFYEDRFAFQQAFDFVSQPVDFFDINNFKSLWIYSNVAPKSHVLDLGCGSGRLACLKAKECRLTGVDFSAKALAIARDVNGYDAVFQGDVLTYRQQDRPFDYVVSLDVFGHIPFADKNRVIAHLKSLLKPGGIMLHGIECGTIDYSALSAEDWERVVETDGHVGIENKESNIARFKQFFEHVRGEVRFDVVAGASDYLKYDSMFPGVLDSDLIDYLRCMDPFEKKAFDLSAGLTLIKIENHRICSNKDAEGFLLLGASDQPLCAMEMAPPPRVRAIDRVELSNDAIFLKGWYGLEKTTSGMFRWAQRRAYLSFDNCRDRRLQMTLFTSYPLVKKKPVELYISNQKNGQVLTRTTLCDRHAKTVVVHLDEPKMVIEIFADVAWVPKLFGVGNDERELSVGIGEINLL